MKKVEVIKAFYDAKNKKTLRKVGDVIKVTEIRAMELIERVRKRSGIVNMKGDDKHDTGRNSKNQTKRR